VRAQLVVVPTISGQVADEHHIKDPVVVEPSKIIVTGPQSVLREQSEIRTDVVDVEGLGPGQHRRRVRLEFLPRDCAYAREDHVVVVVTVEPDVVSRVIRNVVVEAVGTELDASSERVTVTVRGLPDLVERLDTGAVTAYVELGADGASAGTYRRPVLIAGVEAGLVVEVEPATVIVDVVVPGASAQPAGAHGAEP
jgi:hypothetical protein